MKRQITFLTVAMLFSMASALAQGGTMGPLTWNLNNGTLTISGTGDMPGFQNGSNDPPWYEYRESINTIILETGVATIGSWAFYECTNLTLVTIPNSVITIGYESFNGCESLTSVTIPNSVTTIGFYAFYACTSLTAVTIPNSVTTIGSFAFHSCTSLTAIDVASENNSYASENGVLFDKSKSVLICYPAGKTETSYTIPNSVTTIEGSAFSHCTSLTTVTISNSVTTIGSFAFSSCTSLTAVTISNSVTTIGFSAFQSCTSLTSVTIPNSVTTIGSFAFSGCTSLTAVTIPNSVTTIGGGAFVGCFSLTSIDVESENSFYTSENGVLFDKSKTTFICYPAGKTETSYTIPNSVTTIDGQAFYSCTSLTAVTISNSVTTIGYAAFLSCTSLTAVTIPNSVTTIGGQAFYSCTSLTSITNLNLVPVEIDEWAFYEVDQSECTLTVATSAVSAYENAEVWKDFKIVGGGFLVNPVSGNSEQGYTIGDGLYGGRAIAIVEAVAHGGYHFVNWTVNGTVVTDNPYNFPVTEDVELVANFAEGVGIGTITNDELQITVYPNPTNGELRITNDELRIENVEIMDMLGRKAPLNPPEGGRLPSFGGVGGGFNISHLPSGIYFIRIQTENGTITQKIIKN